MNARNSTSTIWSTYLEKVFLLVVLISIVQVANCTSSSATTISTTSTITPTPTTVLPTPPLIPSSLNATTNQSDFKKINVSWEWTGSELSKFELSYEEVSPRGNISTVSPANTSRSWIIDDAKGGTNYSLSLIAIGLSDLRSPSQNATVSTYPAQPGPIAISSPTTDSFSISWTQEDHADSYDITVTDVSGCNVTGSDTTRLISGLPVSGKEYNVTLTARNGEKESLERTGKGRTRPRKPASVTFLSSTQTEIKLLVTKQANTELYQYNVITKQDGQVLKNETFPAINNSTSILIQGLQAGNTYTFEVLSISNGIYSEVYIASGPFKTELSPPQNVRAGNTTVDSIQVTWDHASGRVDSYVVECLPNGNGAAAMFNASVSNDTVTANCTNLTAGVSYSIRVGTTGDNIQYSNWTEAATKLSPPHNVRLGKTTENSIKVTWQHGKGSRDTYLIECTPVQDVNASKYKNSVDNKTLEHMCTDLTAGVRYRVRVGSKKTGFDTVFSEWSETVTNLSLPKNVTVVRQNETSLRVTWEAAEGRLDGYIIECNPLKDETATNYTNNVTVSRLSADCVDLKAGTLYEVKVGTRKAELKTRYADAENAVTVPYGPSGLKVSNQTTSMIQIGWSPPYKTNFEFYKLEWMDKSQTGQAVVINITKNSTMYEIGPLTPSAAFNINLSAVSNYSEKAVNNPAISKQQNTEGWTVPEEVAEIKAPFRINARNVTIRWTQPENRTALNMYILLVINRTQGCEQAYILNRSDTSLDAVTYKDASNIYERCTKIDKTKTFNGINESVETLVEGLQPITQYSFEVYAVSPGGTGVGKSTNLTTTDEEEPGSQVRNVKLKNKTWESIQLEWEEPELMYGRLRYYLIEYSYLNCSNELTVVKTTNASHETSYNITGLQAYWTYNFSVSAFNSKGSGKSKSDTEMLKTEEAAPGPPASFFQVGDIGSTEVTLEWEEPPLCVRNGVIRSYQMNISYSDPRTPDEVENTWVIVNISGDDTSRKVSDLRSYKLHKFDLQAVTVSAGGVASLSNTTDEAEPGPVSASQVTFRPGQTNMTIEWVEPVPRNGEITNYTVQWRKEELGTVWEDATKSNKTKIFLPKLAAFTRYEFRIAAWTVKGQGNFSDWKENATEIGKPYEVRHPGVVATNESSITVNWILPEARTGPTEYKIIAEDTEDPNRTPNTTVTGFNATQGTVTGLDAWWVYKVVVWSITSAGEQNATVSNEVRTNESNPGPVQHFSVDNSDCEVVKLQWTIPKKRDRRGVIKNYTVNGTGTGRKSGSVHESYIVKEETKETYEKTLSVVPELNYTFQIRANTRYKGEEKTSLVLLTLSCPPKFHDGETNGSKTTKVVEPVASDQQKVDDAHRQAMITLLESYFISEDNGAVIKKGLIVAEDGKDPYKVAAMFRSVGDLTKNYSKPWRESGAPIYRIDFAHDFPKGYARRRKRAAGISYTVGADTICENGGYCNGYLLPDQSYRVKAYSCTKGGCTVTAYSFLFQTAKPVNVPLIVGIVIPFLIICVVVVALVYVAMRKQIGPFKQAPEDRMHAVTDFSSVVTNGGVDNPALLMRDIPRKRPIALSDFPAHYADLHRDTDLMFSEEYKVIKDISAKPSWTAAESTINRSKNRWTNILPYDHSRVKLLPTDDEDGSDYINANYIPGYNSRREYIGTQGPLPGTKNDFWRMIWEQNVAIVVMLTQCIEKGRHRCEQYWPKDSDPQYFGDIEVTVRSESVLADYTIRILDVILGEYKRTVKHFNFTAWPDFGCPATTECLTNFVKVVRSHTPHEEAGPIIVHCSAGVGRTGTYIAVDRLLQHIRQHNFVDIYGLVLEMREFRCNMVQTEDQYIYIHEWVKDALEKGLHRQPDPAIEASKDLSEEDLYEDVETNAMYENVTTKVSAE